MADCSDCGCGPYKCLRYYAPDKHAFDRSLARLEVVTMPPTATLSLETACNGTLTCICRACSKERAQRLRQGPKRIKQPWDIGRAA